MVETRWIDAFCDLTLLCDLVGQICAHETSAVHAQIVPDDLGHQLELASLLVAVARKSGVEGKRGVVSGGMGVVRRS